MLPQWHFPPISISVSFHVPTEWRADARTGAPLHMRELDSRLIRFLDQAKAVAERIGAKHHRRVLSVLNQTFLSSARLQYTSQRHLQIRYMDVHVQRRPMTLVATAIVATFGGYAALVPLQQAYAHPSRTHHDYPRDWLEQLLKPERRRVEADGIGEIGNINADRDLYHHDPGGLTTRIHNAPYGDTMITPAQPQLLYLDSQTTTQRDNHEYFQ